MERLCLLSHCDMSVFKRVILVADSNFAICLYFEDLWPWLTITLKLVLWNGCCGCLCDTCQGSEGCMVLLWLTLKLLL